MREDSALVHQFDRDRDNQLNKDERKAAREFIVKERAEGRGPRFPRFTRRDHAQEQPQPGLALAPADVPWFPNAPLYDPKVLRTFFLDFESPDWEKELADFYRTDVEVPAKLTVDGKAYSDVGVSFRGASSFFAVPEGRKRSLGLSLDLVHQVQQLGGYRTLDLLNSHTDPTFLRTMLYNHIARQYIPAPKANYVRLAVNGESWGVYVNAQQINKDFIRDWFGTTQGARWKVPGSPRARGGLEYLGEDVAEYKRHYQIKSKDDPKAWTNFIRLCRVLNQTPSDELEKALAPLLNLENALKFLALENVFVNNDGYWIRSSDYHLYEDEKGQFHLFPHDANETFRPAQGFGRGGGDQDNGLELDPLTGADDTSKPLLSKLLSVPSLRARYLAHIRQMAEQWLDWENLGRLAQQYQSVIAAEIQTDTRKLSSADAFSRSLTEDLEEQSFRGTRQSISLKNFAEKRRAFLLNYPAIKKLPH